METDVLGFKQGANIRKGSIKRIVQVKDGGEGDDSFQSWVSKLRVIGKLRLFIANRMKRVIGWDGF